MGMHVSVLTHTLMKPSGSWLSLDLQPLGRLPKASPPSGHQADSGPPATAWLVGKGSASSRGVGKGPAGPLGKPSCQQPGCEAWQARELRGPHPGPVAWARPAGPTSGWGQRCRRRRRGPAGPLPHPVLLCWRPQAGTKVSPNPDCSA